MADNDIGLCLRVACVLRRELAVDVEASSRFRCRITEIAGRKIGLDEIAEHDGAAAQELQSIERSPR